jgi:hypothetical protein
MSNTKLRERILCKTFQIIEEKQGITIIKNIVFKDDFKQRINNLLEHAREYMEKRHIYAQYTILLNEVFDWDVTDKNNFFAIPEDNDYKNEAYFLVSQDFVSITIKVYKKEGFNCLHISIKESIQTLVSILEDKFNICINYDGSMDNYFGRYDGRGTPDFLIMKGDMYEIIVKKYTTTPSSNCIVS